MRQQIWSIRFNSDVSGVPVAWMLSSNSKHEIITYFLCLIRSWNPEVWPAYLITDCNQAQIAALKIVYPQSQVLLCTCATCNPITFLDWSISRSVGLDQKTIPHCRSGQVQSNFRQDLKWSSLPSNLYWLFLNTMVPIGSHVVWNRPKIAIYLWGK